MENIWYFEHVDLFKILCPTKFGNYEESHVFRTYKKMTLYTSLMTLPKIFSSYLKAK